MINIQKERRGRKRKTWVVIGHGPKFRGHQIPGSWLSGQRLHQERRVVSRNRDDLLKRRIPENRSRLVSWCKKSSRKGRSLTSPTCITWGFVVQAQSFAWRATCPGCSISYHVRIDFSCFSAILFYANLLKFCFWKWDKTNKQNTKTRHMCASGNWSQKRS